jgi:shikimate kinase
VDDHDVKQESQHLADGSNKICKNIVLAGIAGSGKSTVGKHLAILLGFGFLDLDEVIEKSAGRSILQIFKSEGESGFRARESATLEKISNLRSHVLALGGGALQDAKSIALAKNLGPIVWLKPSADEVSRRLYMRPSEIDRRPFLEGVSSIQDKEQRRQEIAQRIQAMLLQRSEMYDVADIVLDGGFVTPETSACQLKDILISMGLIAQDIKQLGTWHKSFN